MSDMRQMLQFMRVAQAAFEFLCVEFGFRLVRADESYLRYETDKVFVNVYRGRSSYSVRFEIGLSTADEIRYYPEKGSCWIACMRVL